ncbi:hypothetical protein R1sor_006511 [Riccia sorocarpa]|uniref:Uncharacterized protein n=1 Tax=Riccia sorocarpa TaxID=122646 RepID=A0ABD3HRG3_9MARC
MLTVKYEFSRRPEHTVTKLSKVISYSKLSPAKKPLTVSTILRLLLDRYVPKQQQEPESVQRIKMASEQERKELDERAKAGEEVVKGGRGGKSLDAQERLAEGRSKGGQTRADQLGTEGYQEMGSKGGQTRASQLGTEGYKEMGKKGGHATKEDSSGEAAAKKGVEIDESKFTNPKE